VIHLLNIKLNLSTAFHPETDGQSEKVNQVQEVYMRSYCSYQQDDSADLVPLTEYANHSAISEATKFSPCFSNYGYEQKTNWPNANPSPEWDNPASGITVSQWETNWFFMNENLAKE
jgi:hypothetical protein